MTLNTLLARGMVGGGWCTYAQSAPTPTARLSLVGAQLATSQLAGPERPRRLS
jgi:hypothetical protein